MKKVLITILALYILFAFSAKAMTADEIRTLINQLKEQLAELQQRMADITDEEGTFQFDANLRYGDISEDVNHLHNALKEQGFSISASEENSTYFGDSTLNAVKQFQEKYAQDVLSPWNLTQGTGFVGQTTRDQLNNVYMEGSSGGESTLSTCTETDTGNDYYNQGTVTYNGTDYADYCIDTSQLKEYFCENNVKEEQEYTCADECIDGACETTAIGCVDTDSGKDYDNKGTVSYNNYDFEDFCVTGSTLKEYFCLNNVQNAEFHSCSDTCANGACALTATSACTDTDSGKDYDNKGTVTYNGSDYTDQCITGTLLKEFYCLNDIKGEEFYACPYGCDYADDICSPAPTSIEVTYPNGGEQWQIGNTYTATWSATNISKVDIYLIGSSYSLTVASNIDSTGSYTSVLPSTIPSGNEYKVKVKDASSALFDDSDDYFTVTTTVATDTCTDTDTGQDYENAGTVTYNGTDYADYCIDTDKLKEYYCVNDVKQEDDEVCANGCASDACTAVVDSINLTSPTGGEKWEIGKTYNITWTSQGITDANIWLSFPAGFTCKIANLFASSGSYSFTLSEKRCENMFGSGSIDPGKYKIKIFGDTDDVADESGEFDICEGSNCTGTTVGTSATIDLTSPTGGETWKLGETYDITWTSQGTTDANIWLSFPAGFTCKIANLFAQNGKYSVTLSNDLCQNMFGEGSIAPGKYKIKIFGDSDEISDESNEFDITASTTLNDIGNQLADISHAVSNLLEKIKQLFND